MLFRAVKVADNWVDVNVKLAAAESRESRALSDGEFTRVGTSGVEKVGGPLVLATFESAGNTRYISTTRSEIDGVPAPAAGTIRPTNEAESMIVCEVRTKSSAASISK